MVFYGNDNSNIGAQLVTGENINGQKEYLNNCALTKLKNIKI